VLFLYDKLKGDTKYHYREKATRFLEYFSNFEITIIHDERYIRKIKSEITSTLVKEVFSNKKLLITANPFEIY